MAQKALLFDDMGSFEKIVNCATPAEAKKLGRGIAGFDERLWIEKRFEIVKAGNIHKFNQHKPLAECLLSTGDHVIAEASPTDNIWGIGMAESHSMAGNVTAWGLNLLGFALMETRDFLRTFGHFNLLENDLLPPWKKYPGIDPLDFFWRTGNGENYIIEVDKYWVNLTERDRMIYELTHPAPPDWEHFY